MLIGKKHVLLKISTKIGFNTVCLTDVLEFYDAEVNWHHQVKNIEANESGLCFFDNVGYT